MWTFLPEGLGGTRDDDDCFVFILVGGGGGGGIDALEDVDEPFEMADLSSKSDGNAPMALILVHDDIEVIPDK
jgi:hypothetical protein